MERKMVFFDLDGTLLDGENRIVPSAKEAIRELKEKGVIVAIATGRAPFMFAHIREELSIDSYVSFNGQFVVKEGEPIYKNPLERDCLRKLDREAGENGHPLVYLDHLEMKANLTGNPYIKESLGSLNFSYPPVDPGFFLSRDIYQALLFCKGNDETTYREKYSSIEMIRWHEFSVDVIPAGGSKARGIKCLLEHYQVERENAYAFGDGLNDVQMLSFVGTGVAMENAATEAKQAAAFVTKSASDDGIVYGLKKLKLLK
ncbi:MAG TPA: Cof-type HAD-IIB family hydrolase [Bacillales bacterium]|nr:Cof-type HAD-IIB family hydrolase [Bacillales bacterium]